MKSFIKTGRPSPSQENLVDKIANALESAIHNGELRPGKRISELALASTLKVSRGPLREAIRKLEARRLFERTAFHGIRLVDLSIEDLEKLLVVRESLEGAAARSASENISEEQLKELKRFAEEGLKNVRGITFTSKGPDWGFHYMVARASQNRWLEEMLCKDLYGLLRAYRYSSTTVNNRVKEARTEHYEIVKAIGQRDGDLAEVLMRKHNRNGRINFIKRLKEDIATDQPSLRPIFRKKKQKA